jgi:hypothetical protein
MLPSFPDMWRLVREVDFTAIRSESERTFRVVVLAEDLPDAEQAASCSASRAIPGWWRRRRESWRPCPTWRS